jgi:predicted O-methyltransferase YrrM
LYERWDYNHVLHGHPDPLPTLPFSFVSDRLRWGPLGRYIWESRRVPGWTRHAEAIALAHQSYALPDGAVVVEIGSFLGCSAILLAGARKLRGSGKVHCIDPFDGSGDAFSVPIYRTIRGLQKASLRERFDRYLARAGLSDWVSVHPGLAQDVLPTWNAPIDLLLFDGDQSYDVVSATYEGWMPFLKPGATLAVHNSRPGYRQESHDGAARLVEELVRPPDYDDVRYAGSMTFARRAAA